MKKALILALFALVLQACQPATPTPPTPTPNPPTQPPATETAEPPTPTPEPARRSVVLISWDGSRADLVYSLMDGGLMPNFASLAGAGLRAEYAQSIDPTLTAAAHNSISSGSFPARTGITSNSFHVTGDDFYWYRVGFGEQMDEAEPVWVTASKAGLTTAAVFFVGGSPAHEDQLADYTIGYGIQDAYSKQWNVSLSAAEGWSDVPESFSPALEGSFTIQNVGKVWLHVSDSTDDASENYDTVVLNTERSGAEPAQTLEQKEWGSLVLLPRAYSGADFLIQEITPESVTLYHTGVERNTAEPKDLLDALNAQFGPFPSGADSYALEHGWITPEDDLYLMQRQSTYMAEVAAWVYETYQPDLLLTWQDPFDSAGHQFLMVDPRQMYYSPGLAETYRGYYEQAAAIADNSLGVMLDAFDLETTTVMLAGDHGMAPIHSVVYVNTILENAGLLTLDSQNYVVLDQTKAFAVCSGGAVHVYINLVGREKGGGTVTPGEYPQVQKQIADLLTNLADPETGDPVFERVLLRSELGPLGLDSANSGDVFAQAVPGYHLDGWRGNDNVFEPADFYGQHGYDSNLPEMRTIFIAAGMGVPQLSELIPSVRIVDYAPTIAALLGFAPAPSVDGSIIPFLVP
ncbi:MAG: alkaline phosphatase family protein [Chloroflexota bacterium]